VQRQHAVGHRGPLLQRHVLKVGGADGGVLPNQRLAATYEVGHVLKALDDLAGGAAALLAVVQDLQWEAGRGTWSAKMPRVGNPKGERLYSET
jgi:hypothetical protein